MKITPQGKATNHGQRNQKDNRRTRSKESVYGDGKVHAIVADGRAQSLYGKSRYLVYVENADGIILWKSIEDMPCVIEYDIEL